MSDNAEKALREFLERARHEMFPKMKSSAMVLSILPDGVKVDAKLALELGAALLFDKPIIIIVAKNEKVSPRLRMVADEYIEYEGGIDNPATQAKLQAAILRTVERLQAKRKTQ
jgi:hypothetical protein